jgi:hypothetical protein
VSQAAENILHWVLNPLDPKEVTILKDLRDRNAQPHDRFWTAHLIACECLSWDEESQLCTVTEKGLEGLASCEDQT